jgi:uncharacterized membrane protein YbaN (DUF454 family)
MSHASSNLPEPTGPQGLQVVHSSFGRLRVHLPDVDGNVSARLRQLPGVTSAEANYLTGNILILFNPQQTSAKMLLAELHALCAPLLPAVVTKDVSEPSASTALVLQDDPIAAQPEGYVTGVRARVYKALGWASVGMAGVGAATPGIPTVPFVVLASYFFVRSSPEAHAWLLRSRWFGQILRDWEEHRGIRRGVKNTALGLMGAGLVISSLIGLPTVVFASIVALEAVGVAIVLRLPVIEDESSPAPAPL